MGNGKIQRLRERKRERERRKERRKEGKKEGKGEVTRKNDDGNERVCG